MTTVSASRPLVVYTCTRVQTASPVDSILDEDPVDVFPLGDDGYLEQEKGATDKPFYGVYTGSISWPEGTGAKVTIGAAVGGVLPLGAATVSVIGGGYPAGGPVGSLVGCTISAFFVGNGGQLAWGTVTTNGLRQVASAQVFGGGKDFTNTGPALFDVVASCNREYWPLAFAHQKSGAEWDALYAAARAGLFDILGMGDDHDEAISNWTHLLTDMTSRYDASHPWWQSASSTADVLAMFKTMVAGYNLIRAKFYNDPPPALNLVDIPFGLQGAPGVSPADFPVYYTYKDYGPNMAKGGSLLRIVRLDTLTFKHPYNYAPESAKTMLGATQKGWLYATLADAKQRNMSVVILSPKDIGNKDNGDSWRGTGGGATGYFTELNEILTAIHVNDWPVAAWLGGDRHQPHAGMFRVSAGAACDALCLCAAPFGADPAGLTPYEENIWVDLSPDACQYATIRLLDDAVEVASIDAYTRTERFGAVIAFGKRIPREIRKAEPPPQQPKQMLPRTARNTLAVTTGAFIYTNRSASAQVVNIKGGTVSALARSRDGTTFDAVAYNSVGTELLLQVGDMVRITNTVVPTLAYYAT